MRPQDLTKVNKARSLVKELMFDPLKDSGVYFWVVGGTITDCMLEKERRDVDLYFRNMSDSERMSNFCINCESLPCYPNRPLAFNGYNCHNRQFLSPSMDTWEFWTYPNIDDLTPEKCISYFDFTVSACAIDSNLDFYYCESFFDDLESRTLNYTGNHYHLAWGEYHSCIKRLQRYQDKGYKLPDFNFWLKCNYDRRDMVIREEPWKPVITTELNILVDRYDNDDQ
ncbi:MAG: hypothetical protein FI729_03190 [SAR202 cluster bacterium]|nr:hypothetical protein [SAR202 cluster bacterium]|tara:strand:- start:3591 stop:4268 length:678 start_codon:yes stop_codon:yes gene_type:complete